MKFGAILGDVVSTKTLPPEKRRNAEKPRFYLKRRNFLRPARAGGGGCGGPPRNLRIGIWLRSGFCGGAGLGVRWVWG